MDQETKHDPETRAKYAQVCENSSENEADTAIVLEDSEEIAGFNGEIDDPGDEKDESGSKSIQESSESDETMVDCHVIDIKSDDSREGFEEGLDRERVVCRICHMSSDESSEPSDGNRGIIMNMDVIHLGCGCKDELSTAHAYCAQVWFQKKGNSKCEVCRQTVKNVTYPRDTVRNATYSQDVGVTVQTRDRNILYLRRRRDRSCRLLTCLRMFFCVDDGRQVYETRSEMFRHEREKFFFWCALIFLILVISAMIYYS